MKGEFVSILYIMYLITRYTFFTSSTKIPSSLLLSLCSFARAEKMDKSRWILASALSYHMAPIAVR